MKKRQKHFFCRYHEAYEQSNNLLTIHYRFFCIQNWPALYTSFNEKRLRFLVCSVRIGLKRCLFFDWPVRLGLKGRVSSFSMWVIRLWKKNTSVINARSVDSVKCQIDPTQYDLSAEIMWFTTLLFSAVSLFHLVSS